MCLNSSVCLVFINARSNIELDMKRTLTDNTDLQTVRYILIHTGVQVDHHIQLPHLRIISIFNTTLKAGK